jgi:uncharacterized protein with PhoU and TrkA domain
VAIFAVVLSIAVGTLVFHALEGWSILDSLYVTAQTVTTVGYGDLTPHTTFGRAFATVFMMVGVGIMLEVAPVSALVGQKLSETNIRSELDIVIVSIRRSDGEIVFNPSGEATIRGGDMPIAIGSSENLIKLNALARGQIR